MMLLCYSGDEITTGISMTNEDSEYPAEYAIDDDPVTGGIARPAKSTTTATTFTLTSSSVAAQGVFLFNLSDLDGATVLFSGGGLTNVPILIPARDLDGHGNNAWLDLRSLGVVAGTSWTIAITGAPTIVQVGRIFLSANVRILEATIGAKFKTLRPGAVLHTVGRKPFVYDKGIRNRQLELRVIEDTDREILEDAWYSAKGRSRYWVLVPWHDRNDPWWVQFENDSLDWTETEGLNIEESTVSVVQFMGLPL